MRNAPIATGGRRALVSLSPCLLVSLSLTATGCSWPGQPDPADRPVPENQVVKFDALYGRHCAGCHGADGKLGPAPPLNDPLFRAGMEEEDVEMTIAAGRSGTPMTAFLKSKGGPLTPAQVRVLAFEIKGVPYRVDKKPKGGSVEIEVVSDPKGTAPKWGSPGPYPDGAPPLAAEEEESPRKKADHERIRKTVFARACAVCHGDRGQGAEHGGQRRLTINDPAFLALVSDEALRRFIITGRPDLGMPNYATPRHGDPHFQPLNAQEVADLVALLVEWRKAGSAGGK